MAKRQLTDMPPSGDPRRGSQHRVEEQMELNCACDRGSQAWEEFR